MLTLGHIVYSNCFPVHAGIMTREVPFPFKIVEGIPTELNRLLFEGKIDVSPSSSIEFAMNPGRYVLLPGLSITSRTRAMSIVLQSRVPIAELSGRTVALTTASATSVVLLRILLELREEVSPNYLQFEQGVEDPSGLADAVLTIGDFALRQSATKDYPHLYDLGALWHEFTGLPFVFALWQVNYRRNMQKDLETLYSILVQSKRYGMSRLRELADAHAERFGIPAGMLHDYWNLLTYDLGDDEKKGLMTYYGYAAEVGAINAVPGLRFWEPGN
jgi:chorismate dehydratase